MLKKKKKHDSYVLTSNLSQLKQVIQHEVTFQESCTELSQLLLITLCQDAKWRARLPCHW